MTPREMDAQERARKLYKGISDIEIAARAGYAYGHADGYDFAKKDIIALIESRISEILGDAQPKPILRAELHELIDKIKNDGK